MTAKSYLEFSIEGVTPDSEPGLVRLLFKMGCLGTQQDLKFRQPVLEYSPEIVKSSNYRMTAYFDNLDADHLRAELARWAFSQGLNLRCYWKKAKYKNWMSNWKKHFRPLKVGGFIVSPPWEKNKKSEKTIFINPAMAFGTGTHATTQFALRLLEKSRRAEDSLVLDVGAGSGILSIAAEKLGAKKVHAIDNDPQCWRECNKNFGLNKTKIAKVNKKALSKISSQYDVVVANIVDGVLISLKEDIWRLCKPGGLIIVSGILTVGAPAFVRDFTRDKDFKVNGSLKNKEWSAYSFIKL